MFIPVSSSTVLTTDGYRDSSERPDSEGTTPVHASEASASVLLLVRLRVRYESDRAGVEIEERKFIRRVFHFWCGDYNKKESKQQGLSRIEDWLVQRA